MAWILVIDDHEDGRELTSLIFTESGFEVEAVPSAPAAMMCIRRRGLPTLVVTDICMSDMDGFDVAHRLRQEAPKLAIFAFTALSELHDPDRVFTGTVRKPARPSEIGRPREADPARGVRPAEAACLLSGRRSERQSHGRRAPRTARRYP